jgi:hypothetical protein
VTSWTQTIRWHDRDGGMHTVESGSCVNKDYASFSAWLEAKKAGWTPPRWWEWWRFGDTRLEDIFGL